MEAQRLSLSGISTYISSGGSNEQAYSQQELDILKSKNPLPLAFRGLNSIHQNTTRSRYTEEVGLLFSFKINKTKNKAWRQEIRAGFSYGNYNTDGIDYTSENQKFRTDTLISQQTGEQIYIDSMSNKYAYYQENADMLKIHMNYILHYKNRNKFSFYTGIGISIGSSLYHSLESNYGQYSFSSIPYYLNPNLGSYNQVVESRQVSRAISAIFTMNYYIPLGMQYRISKRSKWLKQANMFFEFRPGVDVHSQQEVSTSVSFRTEGMVGIRYSFL